MMNGGSGKPEQYLWYCSACEQSFPAGEKNPPECALCGRRTNGGFAARADFSRVDIDRKTFQPYEGDSDWVRSANRVLEFYASQGCNLRALRRFLERLDTRRVLQLPPDLVQALRQFQEDLERIHLRALKERP